MELARDCRNCNGFTSCMDVFGFLINANNCSQFNMIVVPNEEEVKSCKTCKKQIPHTCDTSLD